MKLLYIMILSALLSGCGTFGIGTMFELGEAAKAVEEDRHQPTEIQTSVGMDGAVKSDSDKSIVQQPIINPDAKPTFDAAKAIDGIPTWLIVIVVLSGILHIINSVRLHRYTKGASHDSN